MEIRHLSILAVRIYPESPGMMEIRLEKNKTEAQSKRPQAGNEEVIDRVSSVCNGHPRVTQKAVGCRHFRCFLALVAHLRDSHMLEECQSQSFQRPKLPGRHEHISASKK